MVDETAGKHLRIGTVAPVYEDAARTLAAFGEWVAAARAEGCDVVAFPQESVLLPGPGEAIPGPTFQAIADMTRQARLFVAANLREKDGDKSYLTSFLVSPQGELLSKYRKTHGYSWERQQMALGDDLPVYATPLGNIAFLVGSDIHFPETAMVAAWLGARLVFWATEPEPVRDVYRYEQILRIRAMDELLTIVASDYAGTTSWYSHSVRGRRIGFPIGRSCVVTPAGEFAADTSYQAGLAVATMHIPANQRRPLHLYPRSGRYMRQYDCRALTDPVRLPELPAFPKRTARIALYPGGPAEDALVKFMAKEQPDLVLLPEYGGAGWLEGTPAFTERNLPALRDLARTHNAYVVAGGIQGESWSMAYIFDRQGGILGKYAQTTFGLGHGIKVFDTDFCRLGIVICNDMMFPEIARAEFVLGAELLLCPSQFACPSGMHNHRIMAARAIDNAVYYGVVLPCNEDPWQRVSLVDPYGVYIAQGTFAAPRIPVLAEVDFARGVNCYVPKAKMPIGAVDDVVHAGQVPPELVPETCTNLREEILASRRPELYKSLLNPAGPHPIYAPECGPAQLPNRPNLAWKKPYICEPTPNYEGSLSYRLYQRLPAGLASSLTDGILATGCVGETSDDFWVVWTRDACEANASDPSGHAARITVDLEGIKPVGSVAAHLYSAPEAGAPFPVVDVELSADGVGYAQVAATTAAAQGYLEPPGWPRTDWLVLRFPGRMARYIRFIFSFVAEAMYIAADEVAVFEK